MCDTPSFIKLTIVGQRALTNQNVEQISFQLKAADWFNFY